ncbi:LPS export ABC transporter periplasmic protein LptC [Arenimonas sp.]|uniref:LPS export ABC transporter periplasmic protein LptC n=1 Tax=Arenimonas sp. TaxID=1872635 RepID=UPI0035AD896E
MSRTALNMLLLVLAIGLGSYAAWQWRQNRLPASEPVQRSDYVLRDFELTALDDAGAEAFTVASPYLEREPDGKSLDIRLPVFSFPGESGAWQARSDTARVSPKAEEVQLRGGVDLVGPPSASGLRTRFTTSTLSVFPGEQRASTDDRVNIAQGQSYFAGTGLRVDMALKRFQLLNDTQGTLCATPASC